MRTPFAAIAVAIVRGFVRDKASLFFALVFPLMFLVLFGGLFADRTQSQVDLITVGDVPVGAIGVRLRDDVERCSAVPFASNIASCRVLEKAGYVLEGRMRRSAIKAGVVQDQLSYAVLRGDEDR